MIDQHIHTYRHTHKDGSTSDLISYDSQSEYIKIGDNDDCWLRKDHWKNFFKAAIKVNEHMKQEQGE